MEHYWRGQSGQWYTFTIYEMSGKWNPVPGIYIFARPMQSGLWLALYVGKAINFETRLTPSHSEWIRAVRLGATHVHAMTVQADESVLSIYEKDLIESLAPTLNQQHNPLARALSDFAR